LTVPSVLETWVKANSLTVLSKQIIQAAQIQQAVVAGDRHVGELGAGAFGQQLPGDDVAVMLHFRQQNVSPDLRFLSPQVRATRLMLSVVPRVKMISSTRGR
jgi:hypothetical protein